MARTTGPAAESELQALERFVVDNDDLSELELRVGRFNVFDALGVARAEIRHSNFLAWLLDPAESHGQGALFLKAVLMDLLRQSPPALRPFSPVVLDGAQLRGVEVRREWRRIDILIACREPAFVLAVENKVDSSEHGDQLKRYEAAVATAFRDSRRMFVYLTADRSEASREGWVPYGYADIYRVLDRCRRTNAGAVGGDVLVFLDHYLRLIGSRFMDDAELDELCRRIYRNHRQALDLIFDRVGSPSARLIGDLDDVVRQQRDRWVHSNRTPKDLSFVPVKWLDVLPPIGTRKNVDKRMWIRVGFWCGPDRCMIWCYGYPTTDIEVRRRALERLTRDLNEFGLRAPRRGMTDGSTQLLLESIYSWPEDEEPDRAALADAATKALDRMWERLAGVPDALRPIFAGTRRR